MRLKGIHLAMKSGMLAAETAWEALEAGSCSGVTARRRSSAVSSESWAYAELRTARNFHQGFEHGMLGRDVQRRSRDAHRRRAVSVSSTNFPANPATSAWSRRATNPKETPRAHIDNVLTFDKLTDVYNCGTMHEENQPSHLIVSDTEHLPRPLHGRIRQSVPLLLSGRGLRADVRKPVDGKFQGRLQINFTNCVHCKTCDIADPYQIITWVPPQGGEGPVYLGM